MDPIAKETISANLEQEMRRSYLDYAMSVIVGRALPDVRDGLKPVHRRVLYAMSQLNNDWNKPYKKSARIVGDVIGKFHPHGDSAVYDTIVRMAQSFSLRYPLVDGQGNFGSVDGDSPAAMRYTEIRLARIAHDLLEDLQKETVDFGPNYDETETQPLVLPTRVPNLLVNGSSGIAVGMATNMPPHNLTETINACLALIEDSEISIPDLMQYLPGPDFPTAGIINGSAGILSAYQTGRGRIYVRARVTFEIEPDSDRHRIVVTELPYQVNKARLLEKIAELVKAKRIEGIAGLRDESDKAGMRMVIQLRRGEVPDVVLNNLYQQTQMQSVFGINLVALTGNQPKLFNLKELLQEFLRHRREVVTRRTIFDLRKARDQAHILEGLAIALANIDPIIALIKAAESPAAARLQLVETLWQPGVVVDMLKRADQEPESGTTPEGESASGLTDEGYRLSEKQAQAILDLRLHRLTGLEQEKLFQDYEKVLNQIAEYLAILRSGDRMTAVIREELEDIRDRYGDERRTEIVANQLDLSNEDLIAREDMVVTLSHLGYAKSQPLDDYRAQRRGGRGKTATKTRDEDFVNRMFVANTHDTVLCFSDKGKVYWLKVYQLPRAGRTARGRPLVNLLPLDESEKITTVLTLGDYPSDHHLFFATANGTVKKCPLLAFSKPRSSGLIAIGLAEDDELVSVGLTAGDSDVMLFSSAGKAVRFGEQDVREMGRTARGVRGIKLAAGQQVISMITLDDDTTDQCVLFGTERGFGKRSQVSEFPRHRRGGQGVIAIKINERNGHLVGAELVSEDDEFMLITDGGTLIRTSASEVSAQGRNTQGVRLISLHEEETLVSLNRIDESDNGESEQEE